MSTLKTWLGLVVIPLALVITGCEKSGGDKEKDPGQNMADLERQNQPDNGNSQANQPNTNPGQQTNQNPVPGSGNGGNTDTPQVHQIIFQNNWSGSVPFSITDDNGTRNIQADVGKHIFSYRGDILTLATSVLGDPIYMHFTGDKDYTVTIFESAGSPGHPDWDVR